MDKAHELVRMVARAFYGTDHVVVIDALVKHLALNVEDMRRIFVATGRNKNDLLKLIGRLREGGLVSVYSRLETKANAQKPTTVEYYYVDYRRAIDGTKYRLHLLEEKLRREAAPTEEKKEYRCEQCKSEWTEIQVIDNPDPLRRRSGFACHRCQFPLDYFPNDPDAAEANGPLGVFNEQFGWLIELLRAIDDSFIDEVIGEVQVENALAVPQEKAPLESGKVDYPQPRAMPTAVRGIVTGPEKVEISITANSETTAAQRLAEAEQKARLASQNQLPDWHTRSTVTNEMTAAGQREEAARREREAEAGLFKIDDEADQKTAAETSLDDIFAQLEKAKQDELAAEDEEDEEEEDEEFEDAIPESDMKKVKVEENGNSNSSANVDSSATGTPVAIPINDDTDEEDFEDV
jgi:transcription initiation factor TFIIE subunit alpha